MNEQVLARILPIAIPLVVFAIIMVRNARGRRLRIARLWIYPAIIIALAILVVGANPPGDLVTAGILLAITALGVGIGWYRGKFIKIEINPETHELTSRTSPIGIILILGLFLLRYGLRSYLQSPEAAAPHSGIALVTDGFILFAAGMLATQRLEIWLRARKLLAEATKTPV